MKDDKKLVIGQHLIPGTILDAAIFPADILWTMHGLATASIEEEMEREGLVLDPDGSGITVRVIVECIAIPKESSDGV